MNLNNDLNRHQHQNVLDVKHHSVSYLIQVINVPNVVQKFVSNVDLCIMIVIMDGYVNCVVNKCKLKMNICEKEEDLKKKSIPTPGIEPGPPA
jgi:hypothetical protein